MRRRRIVIASDHAGFDLKQLIGQWLAERSDVEPLDLGPASAERCDYPDYAAAVGRAVGHGEADLGILVCGSGIGISIAANKLPGVRAALCHDATTGALARRHNDANVLCLGARIVGEEVARDTVAAFLEAAFEGGRHAERVGKIHALEG